MQGELGAACEQVPRQSIYCMFHPRLADGLSCAGGRRWLRHTWDEAPGCDVWFGRVSAVIGLVLGGGVAPKLGSRVDLKGASFDGVIPGCSTPVGSVAALWAPTPTPTATCRGWGTAAVLCSAAPLPVLSIVGLDGVGQQRPTTLKSVHFLPGSSRGLDTRHRCVFLPEGDVMC